MKKTCVKIILLLLVPVFGMAQQSYIDSLREHLKTVHTDAARFPILIDLGWSYSEINRDIAFHFHDLAFKLAKKNDRPLDEAHALIGKSYILMNQSKFPESLKCLQQALELGENQTNETRLWFNPGKQINLHEPHLYILAETHLQLALLMRSTGNFDKREIESKIAQKLALEINAQELLGYIYSSNGFAYLDINRLDSALVSEHYAEKIYLQTGHKQYLCNTYEAIGKIYLKKGNKTLALQYLHKGINSAIQQNNFAGIGYSYAALTAFYLSESQKDSSLYYAKKTLQSLMSISSKNLDQAYENLYKSYRLSGKTDSAYKYQSIALIAKDSSYQATTKSLAEFQKLSFQAQVHAQELEKEKGAIQTKIRTYVLLAGIAVLLLLAGIFYRNNRQKQKVNNLLHRQKEEIVQQKEEIESQRDNVEKTLTDLKATQNQLIQSEKMASLGELTAGIAHEIQNPLNFVNNFSEVSIELISELKEEEEKGNKSDVIAIADDLSQNLEKIRHHGQRADAIVKGMLQHSQASSGHKEPTDLNALADEYLRLAYHGLRAKDKRFNAELITRFDEKLPKINVIPQDIGRVLLNVINNAFYATQQRAKGANGEYKPEVTVTTSTNNSQVMIGIKDNGSGIPDNIKDKIMQPFFTTKPTGEGTGLGLSLSYDIAVKGHGGNIEVVTKIGEYTEFIVTLPLS